LHEIGIARVLPICASPPRGPHHFSGLPHHGRAKPLSDQRFANISAIPIHERDASTILIPAPSLAHFDLLGALHYRDHGQSREFAAPSFIRTLRAVACFRRIAVRQAICDANNDVFDRIAINNARRQNRPHRLFRKCIRKLMPEAAADALQRQA